MEKFQKFFLRMVKSITAAQCITKGFSWRAIFSIQPYQVISIYWFPFFITDTRYALRGKSIFFSVHLYHNYENIGEVPKKVELCMTLILPWGRSISIWALHSGLSVVDKMYSVRSDATMICTRPCFLYFIRSMQFNFSWNVSNRPVRIFLGRGES